jgi:tRNA threonylcarbamoyladenosine biosynthesis protein TsaE
MFRIPSVAVVSTEDETKKLASDFMSVIIPGERIILNGQLGAGKTFFVKSALSSLGISNANSPSFAIVNEYDFGRRIYHFDFFRLKNAAELFDIGWQDYMNDEDSIVFIEWGNLIPEVLPEKRIQIEILMKNGTGREFNFTRYE